MRPRVSTGESSESMTATMPRDVRRRLLSALHSDLQAMEREEALIDERFAKMLPLNDDGTFTTAQKANARGFARKTLARELGLWPAAA